MKIIEVSDNLLALEWLNVPKSLYKGDQNWICPLDAEIEGIFNPNSNTCFQHGEAIRWILRNNQQESIGRIAAFVDYKKAKLYEFPIGGAGFFECIDSQDAANILFNAAKEWLQSKDMEAMQAPINFGENYIHWGLLVEGFVPQGYGMQYNFPYYQQLFENFGFRNYFGQFSFHKPLSESFPERMVKFAEYTASRPGFTFEHFNYRNAGKYIDDFVYTYNAVWSRFHDKYTPMQHDEIRKLLDEARMVIDPEFIWFAYDKGKPVGLMAAFPDINQILSKLGDGKLTLLNKFKLLYYRRRAISRSRVFIFGILPEYQNTGLVAALFLQLVNVLKKRPKHTEIELSWVGDYNPKMINIYRKIGGILVKKHVTYLYMFNPDAKFKRFDNEFDGKMYN
jgi:hypothetical protein